jgi:hypothetical protein
VPEFRSDSLRCLSTVGHGRVLAAPTQQAMRPWLRRADRLTIAPADFCAAIALPRMPLSKSWIRR